MIPAIRGGILAIALLLPTLLTLHWVGAASERVTAAQAPTPGGDQVATAQSSDEQYCTPELKKILRRVLQSCGLLNASGARGCQPVQAKNVATMSGSDFNALFRPMQARGGIIQFDRDAHQLDAQDTALIDAVFSDQRGASYFFVVARASPEGAVEHNRDLSKQRAESVMKHLQETFRDPDLEREVGLLWLGEEFAQLEEEFCQWRRSGGETACKNADLNRSAFIAWIDCQL
jgi:outer membrane protein OmpA-like peptidoglycan-associated protein